MDKMEKEQADMAVVEKAEVMGGEVEDFWIIPLKKPVRFEGETYDRIDLTGLNEIKAADNANTLIADKATEYAKLQSSAEAAARRGYVDDIIEAQDTRKYVIGAYEMLFTKREDRPDKKHGCV